MRDENGDIIAITTSDSNGFYMMAGFDIGTLDVEFVDPATGDVIGTINGRSTVLSNQEQAIIAYPEEGQLVLTTVTPLDTIVLGTSVPYIITVQNTSGVPVQAHLVDTLPTGFVYTPGTGTIEGVAFDPIIGASLATPATATVRRVPEAVFDCSDDIGKVFDDRNFNGHQDDVERDDRAKITDQSVFTGKFSGKGVSLPTVDKRELGLANIHISTPTGTIITTDEHGRFNVPCAELPDGSGKNFTLKIDERSLPTGYRITTENLRTMRLTVGIVTEMNFGAALGRVLDVDLTAAAILCNVLTTAW